MNGTGHENQNSESRNQDKSMFTKMTGGANMNPARQKPFISVLSRQKGLLLWLSDSYANRTIGHLVGIQRRPVLVGMNHHSSVAKRPLTLTLFAISNKKKFIFIQFKMWLFTYLAGKSCNTSLLMVYVD